MSIPDSPAREEPGGEPHAEIELQASITQPVHTTTLPQHMDSSRQAGENAEQVRMEAMTNSNRDVYSVTPSGEVVEDGMPAADVRVIMDVQDSADPGEGNAPATGPKPLGASAAWKPADTEAREQSKAEDSESDEEEEDSESEEEEEAPAVQPNPVANTKSSRSAPSSRSQSAKTPQQLSQSSTPVLDLVWGTHPLPESREQRKLIVKKILETLQARCRPTYVTSYIDKDNKRRSVLLDLNGGGLGQFLYRVKESVMPNKFWDNETARAMYERHLRWFALVNMEHFPELELCDKKTWLT